MLDGNPVNTNLEQNVPVKVGMPLSFLARPERCPIGNQRREGGSVRKVVTISMSDWTSARYEREGRFSDNRINLRSSTI